MHNRFMQFALLAAGAYVGGAYVWALTHNELFTLIGVATGAYIAVQLGRLL